MRVYTKQVFQMHDDGSFELLECESYEHHGPVAQCFGGSTESTTQATQITETTSVGLSEISGIGIAGGGDVDVSLETTDLGAIQGAFDFAEGAFDFASSVSEQASEVSQAAVASSLTGGQSDIQKIDSRTIGLALAALVAILVLPQVFRRA
jgi:hypothetical protein